MMRLKPLLILVLLAACSSATGSGTQASLERSTDPLLNGFMEQFREACIANAPEFPEGRVAAAFNRSRTALPALLSARPGQTCRMLVRGYGSERPEPTAGDVAALGRALHSKIGGSYTPPSNRIAIKTAKVTANRDTFSVFAYVNRKGELTLSIVN